MTNLFELIQTVFYPFGYFLLLGLVYAISKFVTLFLVTAGRLKSFHAIENYWIYLLITLFCLLIGICAAGGHWLPFWRWFLCSWLAALIGIHFGFEKGSAVSDKDMEEFENNINDHIRNKE
ncbi:hypothetical protein FO440_23330 [Mucilaginibacter corticis]|uniref:Uncharacterized protein n=1 Tax=Mucilaginibacter corticis TaxID=2597670 RepID=A0A556M9B0_9SPHI|nr:hypothetical protein [Mucilaginibacter corticis]TSJ36436.1 hypothetical protein FO440_23330 [Mucilaginibacter corticis]